MHKHAQAGGGREKVRRGANVVRVRQQQQRGTTCAMLQSSSANSAAVRNPPLELDVSTLPFPATLRHSSSRRYCTVTVTVTVTPRGLCHGLLSYCFSNPQATHSSPLIPPAPSSPRKRCLPRKPLSGCLLAASRPPAKSPDES